MPKALVACPGCGKKFPEGMSILGHERWCEAYRAKYPVSQKAGRRARKAEAVRNVFPSTHVPGPTPPPPDVGGPPPPTGAPPAQLAPPVEAEAPAPVAPPVPPPAASDVPPPVPRLAPEPMKIHIEVPKEGSQEPLKPLPEFLGEAPPQAEKKEYMDKSEMANLIDGIGELYNVQVNKMMTGEARDPRELIRWSKEDTAVVVNSAWPVIKKYGWDSDAFFAILLKYGPEIGCVLGIGMLIVVKLQAMLAIRKAQREGGRQESIGGPETSPGRGAAPTSDEDIINRAWRDATGHIGR